MTEQAKVPAIRFAGFTDPWEQRKLVDIAEIVGGGTPDTNNSNYWDGDIDWYAPAELGNNIYAESSTRKITQAGFDSCSTKMLPADKTILFTSRAGIGNTAILRHSACTNQGFQSLVIGDADVYYVYSMSERIKKWAEEKASGSTFLEISGRQLETMPVNLPSLVEQQAIGSFFPVLTTSSPFISVSMTSSSCSKSRCLKKCSRRMASLYPRFVSLVLLTLGNSVSSLI